MAENLDLANPDLYINRELSFLQFNRRVLEQAKNPDVPLLERLRFLCITSSNLDEFFEIRVAGLKQRNALGSTQRGPDNLTPAEQLRAISVEAHALVEEQYRVLNDTLFPALEREGIQFLHGKRWNKKQGRWLKRYFNYELEPILTPIGLDPAHPFPRLLNKNLTFIVTLEGKDAFGRNSGMAIVQAPRALPRVVRLPDSHAESPYDLVFLSSIIETYVDELFSGMRVSGCYQFRVTRNSDLFVDAEEVDNLLRAVEGELLSRRFGDAVRLELAEDCPGDVAHFLQMQFDLGDDDVYRCDGPVNLMRLNTIPDEVARPDLKYAGFTPRTLSRIRRASDLFAAIREGDILLHHPFDSFLPVIDFLRQAAADPGGAFDPADAIPHRGRLGGCQRADRRGGQWQGSPGRHRTARPFRRGRQHRTRHQPAGGGCAGGLRCRRIQDARQDVHGDPPGRQAFGALCPRRNGQLPHAHGATVYGLRTIHL